MGSRASEDVLIKTVGVAIARVKFLSGDFWQHRETFQRTRFRRGAVLKSPSMLNGDGVDAEWPAWEPEPFELPLVIPRAPLPAPSYGDEPTEPEPSARVIVIDLA